MFKVVFTDLDGTLLDHANYDATPALAAVEGLRRGGVPLVFVTSKSRLETEWWRRQIGNGEPFVVENGGAAIVPPGSFAGAPERMVFGSPRAELIEALQDASAESGCPVRGFHEMSDRDVAERSGLPLELATLARQREYDEPFEVLDSARAAALLAAIEARGKRWTRGGRFHHITGACDKALAAQAVLDLYRSVHGDVRTYAFGDGWNDVPLLNLAETPIVIRSRTSAGIAKAVPRARITRRGGPTGWSAAVFDWVL